jgi:membrane-associated phospholipid phosphatase
MGFSAQPVQRSLFDRTGAIVFSLAVCLAIVDLGVRAFDKELFLFLNSLHSPYSDPLWLFFTTLGNGYILAVLAGLLLTVDRRAFLYAVILLILSGLVVNFIKLSFPTLRPVSLLDDVHVIGPLLRSGSFPSGHSASAMVAALSLIPYLRPWYWRTAILVAALVGLSRVFVAAHFPGDVLGGWVCALLLFGLTRPFMTAWIDDRVAPWADPPHPGITILLILEGLLIIVGILVYAPLVSESAGQAIIILVIVGLVFFYRLIKKIVIVHRA